MRRNSNVGDGDNWVMVDDDGQKTLFQLVEKGRGADALRLANEIPARAIVVDIALPALPALDQEPGGRPRAANSRLILLKVRTAVAGDDDASHAVRIGRARPEPVGTAGVASPD
jgi:hypothetical protein